MSIINFIAPQVPVIGATARGDIQGIHVNIQACGGISGR
jgi:hypothetical protein